MAAPPKLSDTPLTPWLDMADAGAVIVTSNQRAARYLLQQHTALARSRGLAGWATPRILTWDAWLSELWRQVALVDESAPALISSAQENELWRAAVAYFDKETQWNEAALATLAQQAWQLLQQYTDGLPTIARYPLHRPDWQQFQKWATKFSTGNRRAGWLPQAQLARELELRFRKGEWQAPAELILWGFDNFTPAQERLISTLRESSQLRLVEPFADAAGTVVRNIAFASQRDEVHAVASWARDQLKVNPQARLAVITTKAAEDRGLIYRTFTREPAVGDFNFSLGSRLSHTSLVRTALALLRWIWQPLSPQAVSALLLSPSLTRSDESLLKLAEFDCDEFLQRNAADPAATLEQFVRWLQTVAHKKPGSLASDLLVRCQSALQLNQRRENDSADTWADLFRKILAAFQFPSPLANSSADFQTLQRWERLLDDFAALSFNGTKFAAQQALDRLQQMADQTILQPESVAASIEILGPLEASGSLFDGIFFIDCTEDRWPIPVSSNPLLSLDLQQAHGMPGAVRGASVTDARKMTERLLRSAPEVNFGFPTHVPEGEMRPSSVIDGLRIAPSSQSGYEGAGSRYLHPASKLIASDDLSPLPWQFDRRRLYVAALRSQAACPFQAFATQRLGTRDLKEPEDGLDALERGNLLHKLLHDVWLDSPRLPGLKTSARLREVIDSGALENFVDERAMALIHLQDYSPWEREFLLAERERIVALVCRWLTQVELQRIPFEVAEGETRREIAIEDLVQMSLRLDRLDRLVASDGSSSVANDEYILIDYKTGEVDLKGWRPPRLDEPQLPIYADYAVPAQPVAVAFASLRAGKEMGLRGLAARAGILPLPDRRRSPVDTARFSEVLEDWRTDIVDLAREFAAGDARVSPKHGSRTCEYCGLQSLCRVAETGELLRDEDETEPHD